MILLWGILMPGLPRFCPFDGFLLSSCCRRRTQRWMNDSMPCTHLNLICVILCRKKFRDHNEITRLKMINSIEQFFFVFAQVESIHTETKLHVSWANEQILLLLSAYCTERSISIRVDECSQSHRKTKTYSSSLFVHILLRRSVPVSSRNYFSPAQFDT